MARRGLVVLLILLAAGCGMSDQVERAEAWIHSFHERLTAQELDEIWRRADPEFRRGTSADAWARFVRIHQRLGAPRDFEIENWGTSETAGEPDRLAVTTRTRFEHGRAREAFTLAESPDGLVLLRYDILDPQIGGADG